MTDQRFLLVVNPRGGKRRGLTILEQIQPVFAAAGAELDVRVTERSGHALEIARTTDLDGYAGLEHLKGLAKLNMLLLPDTQVTDAGVKELKSALPNVQILR